MDEDQKSLPPKLKQSIWRTEIPPKIIRYIRNSSIALFLLLVVVGFYGAGCFDSDQKRINKWLEFHRLARLPQSATNIIYYQWNGLFTGETYIKFQMASNDMASFITNSTGLLEGKSDIFTPQHQHLPYPQKVSDNVSEWHFGHEYFRASESFPKWFNLTITNKGRSYILYRGPNSEVYINEDTSTVYLRSIKG